MDDDELLGIMADWNYWGNFRREWIPRDEYVNRVLDLLKGVNVVALSGIRRAGKSSIAQQVIGEILRRGVDPRDSLVVKLDDERLIDLNYNVLLRIIDLYFRNVKRSDSVSYVVIDEAQEVDGWERAVRGLAEKGNKVIVTGSSAKLLSSEYTTLLSGRHVEVRVFPLRLGELLVFKGVTLRDKLDEVTKIQEMEKGVEELMNLGGFPDVVLHTDIADQLLASYFETVVLKDVIGRYKIRNERKLRTLAKFYITSTGSRITYNSVSKFLKIPVKTVERYSEYLEKVYILFFLNSFSWTIKVIENSPRKVYVVDNGFVRVFNPRSSRGRLFESLVAQHVYRFSLSQRMSLYYWLDSLEVDLVVAGEDKAIPIQVVYDVEDQKVLEREIRALRKFREKFGGERSLLVVYRGEEREISGVNVIPVRKFLLHLEDYLTFNK